MWGVDLEKQPRAGKQLRWKHHSLCKPTPNNASQPTNSQTNRVFAQNNRTNSQRVLQHNTHNSRKETLQSEKKALPFSRKQHETASSIWRWTFRLAVLVCSGQALDWTDPVVVSQAAHLLSPNHHTTSRSPTRLPTRNQPEHARNQRQVDGLLDGCLFVLEWFLFLGTTHQPMSCWWRKGWRWSVSSNRLVHKPDGNRTRNH